MPLFAAPKPVCTQRAKALLTVAIDTEEDFDWNTPTVGTSHSTSHLGALRTVETIFAAYRIVPTYLLTYPVLLDTDIVRLIQRQLEKGRCAVGIQLHPWVTPPLDGDGQTNQSFLRNISPEVEERKLVSCIQKFRESFGLEPKVFRAGRYGLSEHTSLLLERHGFLIDTSVAPRTDSSPEGGPDYSTYDCGLFRFGVTRDLFEIPLCRSIVGWGGDFGARVYNLLSRPLPARLHLPSLLTRSRFAERITLSPEGNDARALRRLARALRRRGQGVFALSFHSSSLQAGRNPYVRTRAELHGFYDRLSETLDNLVVREGFAVAELLNIPRLLGLTKGERHPAAAPAT